MDAASLTVDAQLPDHHLEEFGDQEPEPEKDAVMTNVPVLLTVRELLDWADLRGEALTIEELREMCGRVGRTHAPELVISLFDAGMITAENAAITAHAWSGCEWPHDELEEQEWRDLFGLAGYTDNLAPAARPNEALTLYRGAPEERRAGWSWTADLDVARRFAYGGLLGRPMGSVWVARVAPERLFARIDDRNEHGYVVDTRGLDIELLEDAAPPAWA